MRNFFTKVKKILGSRWFFWGIVAFFVAQAIYIALTARYPMAFDEDFHLGIIKLYAHQWSPFFAHQPANANQFGAVARDPSYLYHYLMSFPYRAFHHFFKSDTANIIFLRLFSVGFFTGALVVFKRLFEKYLKTSSALTNTVLLFFVLTPIVPLLAAQINYDNLLILLVAASLFFALAFVDKLKTTGKFDIRSFCLLFIASSLAALTKYSFLPIFLAIYLYIGYYLLRLRFKQKISVLKLVKNNYRSLSTATKVFMVIGVAVCMGLIFERDGINTLKYGTPAPQCNKILSIDACKAYSPWYRNYQFAETKGADLDTSAFNFTKQWIHQYFTYSLFYALNGLDSGFSVGGPMPIPQEVGRVVFWVGIGLVVIFYKKIFRRDNLFPILGLVVFLYTLTLWSQNYSDYKSIGQAVAEQGRYLVIVLPLAYLIVAVAVRNLLDKKAILKPIVASGTLLLFLQGGGVSTYIMSSDATWFWPNSVATVNINHAAKKVLRHVIVHPKDT